MAKDGQNETVPVVLRPDPPPPMSVAIASRVFGSEVLVGLIRHYRQSPSTQTEAAAALDLSSPLVSTNTRVLEQAGVVYLDGPRRGVAAGKYRVDEARVRMLSEALLDYVLGEPVDEDPQ